MGVAWEKTGRADAENGGVPDPWLPPEIA